MNAMLPVTARNASAPATALGSGNPDDLALIVEPSIALVQWWRQPAVVVPAEDLATFAAISLEGDATDVGPSVSEELALNGDRDWHASLAADVATLAARFVAISRCDEIGLRIEVIESNACKRFHADYVRLRLITTYVGPGTQWLIDCVDPTMQQVATGHVAILKGRDPDPVGILHRSPPIEGTGVRRLVLTIDPLRDR